MRDFLLENISFISLLAIFLPLFASLVIGLNTKRISDPIAQYVTCTAVIISAICSIIIFNYVVFHKHIVHINIVEWFNVYNLKANWAIYIDVLTAVMLLVVTLVSAVVHVYSIGYMSHDEHKQRFMAYLSLFTFCMLMLVTSDNFMQLFFGWEGVGLCSYLLIGFWFKKDSANAAAIKAFLVNRVGDVGFALGIFTVFTVFDDVQFLSIFPSVQVVADQHIAILGFDVNVITLICLLLFIGAMGKSAQIGLHTWLPDAMEGPTPVSALIHAATMVTAGVFMVCRCSPLFEYSDTALATVTIVGAVTCIFAASIALVQNDIKRIIAYSTCSQLGYMFFACGVSAYSAAIFHLMTHAFFKALLFLGAGSVIHAMNNEQDIRKMGGIWRKIPFTYAMMWVGSLALAGFFPFAGFYSKDVILEAAFVTDKMFGSFAYILGIITALFTAFYSWRLIILVFHGNASAPKGVFKNMHESPSIMLVPLFILAVGATLSGYAGDHILGMVDSTHNFWRGSIFVLNENNPLKNITSLSFFEKIIPMLLGLLGVALAFVIYSIVPIVASELSSYFKNLYRILLNKWYVDEAYNYLFVNTSKKIGMFCWRKFDNVFIDGMPNGAAIISGRFARIMSILQTGFVYHYALVMMIAMLAFLTFALYHFNLM